MARKKSTTKTKGAGQNVPPAPPTGEANTVPSMDEMGAANPGLPARTPGALPPQLANLQQASLDEEGNEIPTPHAGPVIQGIPEGQQAPPPSPVYNHQQGVDPQVPTYDPNKPYVEPLQFQDPAAEHLVHTKPQQQMVQQPPPQQVNIVKLSQLDEQIDDEVDRVIDKKGEKRRIIRPKEKSQFSRKYFAVDLARVSFWVQERPAWYHTEVGMVRSQQTSGFDAIITDMVMCTVEEVARRCPPMSITIIDEKYIQDIKHMFYPIHLDKLKDKTGRMLPPGKIQRAQALFIHVVAAPEIDPDTMLVGKMWPKGAQYHKLPPLNQTVHENIVYIDVPHGTPKSYDPDKFELMDLETGGGPTTYRRSVTPT